MKHWIAVLLLVVVATFLAVSDAGHCDDGHSSQEHAQHLLCVDDCAPALIPQAPTPPPPNAVPESVFEPTLTRPILNLDLEPEKEPPRA